VSGLGDRLRARGVDPAAFLSWAQSQASAASVGSSDRTLDDIISEYRSAVGAGRPRSTMTPELAHRLFEEGTQRHRDRLLVERVTRQVVREAARAARSQWQHCNQCTPRVPCYRHEG